MVFFLFNALVGGVLIAGARKMKRLEAYEFSVISSLMAGLQIATPTFPVSFLIGGWAFWVLRKPEVKAAFAAHLRQRARGPAGTILSPAPTPGQPVPRARCVRQLSTTGCEVLFCLIGLAACTLAPWIDLRAEGWTNSRDAEKVGWSHNPKQVTRKPGEGEYVAGRFQIDGVETGQGLTGAAICLLLCVFLIATSSLHPAPVWRHLTVVSAALALLGVSGLFLIMQFGAGTGLLIRRFSEYPGGTVDVNYLQVTSGSDPYITVAAALGLLVLGAVQLYRATRPEARQASRTPGWHPRGGGYRGA
jgi:hypothetical protein